MCACPWHLDNRNRVLLSWMQGRVTILATVLCVSLLTLGRAVAVEEPSLETCDAECSLALASELAKAYDQNNPRAIDLLRNYFNAKLNILFESGELEQAVRLLQIVTPAASKWAEPILSQLTEWQTLEGLVRNQFEPTRIAFARPMARDEKPLLISVEGEGRSYIDIYRSFDTSDSSKKEEWIGEAPQYVILSRVLIDSFFGSKALM